MRKWNAFEHVPLRRMNRHLHCRLLVGVHCHRQQQRQLPRQFPRCRKEIRPNCRLPFVEGRKVVLAPVQRCRQLGRASGRKVFLQLVSKGLEATTERERSR